MKVSLTPPPMCRTCGEDFADGEERVLILRNAVPVEKQFEGPDGRWGFTVEDGDPIYTLEVHHTRCAPSPDQHYVDQGK